MALSENLDHSDIFQARSTDNTKSAMTRIGLRSPIKSGEFFILQIVPLIRSGHRSGKSIAITLLSISSIVFLIIC
jgi:hypothetical protein